MRTSTALQRRLATFAMPYTSPAPGDPKRDFGAAFRAGRKLLADPHDTAQVFVIMRALNGPVGRRNYDRLVRFERGGPLAYQRVELAHRLSDPGFIASFASGTVGAAYRTFIEETGYSARGLAEVSNLEGQPLVEHPYAWFGRRMRDAHDVWHVLTGYHADESLGEAALVAFSYAQSGGWGWAFIALASVLESLRITRGTQFARAVVEGYRRGRAARWLMAEDYERLMHEPLEAARARLGLREPVRYLAARKALGERFGRAEAGAARAGT